MEKKNALKFLVFGTVLGIVVFPFLSGHWTPLIVLSDSMEPVMSSGDLIVYERAEASDIREGDILAFEDPSGRADVLITHRVISISTDGELSFQTKGDAVNEQDPFTVGEGEVRGKIIAQIPYLGYLFHHGQSPYVLFLMVLAPAAMITAFEVNNISKYANPVRAARDERKEARSKRRESRKSKEINFKIFTFLFISFIIFFGVISFPSLLQSGYVEESREVEAGILPKSVYYSAEGISVPQHAVVPGRIGRSFEAGDSGVLAVAPAFVPAFWVGVFGGLWPYLPASFAILGPSLILVSVLYPVWGPKEAGKSYRKRRRGKRKR